MPEWMKRRPGDFSLNPSSGSMRVVNSRTGEEFKVTATPVTSSLSEREIAEVAGFDYDDVRRASEHSTDFGIGMTMWPTPQGIAVTVDRKVLGYVTAEELRDFLRRAGL